jgi:hypothetical protein
VDSAAAMSFLRKRSRSQSSAFNGERDGRSRGSDRKELKETLLERRFSGVSDVSTRPDDYGLHDSCVHVFPSNIIPHVLIGDQSQELPETQVLASSLPGLGGIYQEVR